MHPYILSASLMGENIHTDVHVAYASKSSLHVRALNGSRPPNGAHYDYLKISVTGGDLQLGKCRFVASAKTPSFDGRLIFTEDVYDLYQTLVNGKIANLETHFQNSPVVLKQKNSIKAEFRDYTTNLVYDLNAYKSYFDKIDAEYRSEDSGIFERIQDITIEKKAQFFFDFFDERLADLKKLITKFSPEEHQAHGYYFRRQLWGIISDSSFMTRTNLKPRKYAGDSMTLNMVYDNGSTGDSIFAKLMHKHPLGTPAAEAVRNRKKIISELINSQKNLKMGRREKIRVMSVACGSAREIEDIIQTREDAERLHFTLLDQDAEALAEAEENIRKRQSAIGCVIDYSLFPQSVRTLIRFKDLSAKTGMFHFIYSMGLYDYLTDRIACQLTRILFELLEPGGVLVISNYHKTNPTMTYMEYWMDWVLYYRNEQEFMAVADGIDGADKSIEFDKSGSQMFLKLHKKPR